MQKKIEIAPMICSDPTHQGNIKRLMCLNVKCEKDRVLCSECQIENHQYCKVEEIKKFQEKIRKMQSLYRLMIKLQTKIQEDQFKVDLSVIEQYLQPISTYQASPNITNLNIIGGMLREMDNFYDACKIIIDHLIQIISYVKQDAQFFCDIGRKLQLRHRLFNQAIRCFDLAIKFEPKVLRFYYYKCWTLYQLERHEEAIHCFDTAIQIEQNNIWSWYQKGQLLLQLKRYLEAMKCFDTALVFGPECNDGDSYTFLRYIYFAVECYQNIIQMNIDSDACFHAKKQLQVAQNVIDQIELERPNMLILCKFEQ